MLKKDYRMLRISDVVTEQQVLKLFDLVVSLNQPLFDAMANTHENSCWHREPSVLVHTNMVLNEFLKITWSGNLLHNAHADGSMSDLVLGSLVCMFHDTGKPRARTEKFSEQRGKYFSYGGHELISARLFENFAMSEIASDFHLSETDVFKICWIIEHHMPWEIKDIKKLTRMAETVIRYNMVDVFKSVLLADQRGRISDDADTHMAKVYEWLDDFSQICENLNDYVEPPIFHDFGDNGPPILYMLIGCSGSGKSTFSASFDDAVVYSFDDLRLRWYDATDYSKAFSMSVADKKFDSRVNAEYVSFLKRDLDKRHIIDNTNTSAKRRAHFIDTARKRGYTVVAVVFPIALSTVISRQNTRSDKCVPANAVERQYMNLQLPSYGEFDDIIIQVQKR